MPINPWLALDAATPPASLARELRRAWELFLTGGEPDAVRAPIAASWQRSQAAGVDPLVERVAPVAANVEEASARWDVHPLAVAAPLIHECLEALEAQHLVVVGDADGTLLWVEGDPAVRLEAADSMNFTEGAAWSETGAERTRSGSHSRPATRRRSSPASTSTPWCRRGCAPRLRSSTRTRGT